MKRILVLLAAVVLLGACSKSPEEKANALIKENIQKDLYIPDSYDPTETVIDSAFSPTDDPTFHEKLLKSWDLSSKYVDLEDEVNRAKSSMLIYANPYDAYSRNEYEEQKQKYENLLALLENMQEKLDKTKAEFYKLGEQIKKEGKKFIGFKVKHTYRAKNNAGNVLIGHRWFLIDKDFTKILVSYDMDGEEFQTLEALMEQIRESAE